MQLLDGLRVIEFGSLLNASTVGMMLGDLGADVIKVEAPGEGDYLRNFLGQIKPGWSPAHLQVNKNKRSMTLDVRKPRAREIFFDLVKTTDVVVDGSIGDSCVSLGIGYDEQREFRPDLVYCQYTGFGAAGPYRSVPTHGQMMNALAGSIPAEMGEDGNARHKPSSGFLGGTVHGGEASSTGASFAAMAILAALFQRSRTGEGAYIDTASSDAVIASSFFFVATELNMDRITDKRTLPVVPITGGEGAKYQVYETSDGKFIYAGFIEHKFWDKFCAAVDRPDLAKVKDESAPVDFGTGEPGLRAELQKIFWTRTQEEWMKVAVDCDVPLGPVHELADLPSDPHLSTRSVFVEGQHPKVGPFSYVGVPSMVRGQQYTVRRGAPALGEHTEELLAELGYDAQLAQLRAEGVC